MARKRYVAALWSTLVLLLLEFVDSALAAGVVTEPVTSHVRMTTAVNLESASKETPSAVHSKQPVR